MKTTEWNPQTEQILGAVVLHCYNKRLFEKDRMGEIAGSDEGLLWLKVKAITRKQLMNDYCKTAHPHLVGQKLKGQSENLYTELLNDTRKAHIDLDRHMKAAAPARSQEELEAIASELHKVKHFSWGGDYSNALDRFLVDRYIKAYASYATMEKMLETEIPQAVSGYVICSWYNHWSTVLIENLFRKRRKVVPAIGNIKKVDFFIENIPFDLKTTYLPANYVKRKRKEAGLRDELAELKSAARENGICFDSTAKLKSISYEITERIKAMATGKADKPFRNNAGLESNCLSIARKIRRNFCAIFTKSKARCALTLPTESL